MKCSQQEHDLMEAIPARIQWQRGTAKFTDNRYSRNHTWQFQSGTELEASASIHIVPVPMVDPQAVDPEEAFVASLSSCHMLWFLSLAAAQGWGIDRYIDEALGVWGRSDVGRLVISKVILRPKVSWIDRGLVSNSDVRALHHRAHEECFLAHSVRCDVTTEPQF